MADAARRDASIRDEVMVSLILDHVVDDRSPGEKKARHDA
jgi:hypothetical protein